MTMQEKKVEMLKDRGMKVVNVVLARVVDGEQVGDYAVIDEFGRVRWLSEQEDL